MPDKGLHFAQPLWLWGLLLIPLVLIWLRNSAPVKRFGLEQNYADVHLLSYLTGVAMTRASSHGRSVLGWILLWCLLIMAMAGPRLGYHRINPFDPGVDLVVLLDISDSMNVTDVAPSRLERARQEIQDLVRTRHGMRIGLVAFATVAHVVTPITEDRDSLLLQLPALSTGLVRLQGSRLFDALDRAERLLGGQDVDVAHNILLISDGDLSEVGIDQRIRELRAKGIRFHVLAVGTAEGGPVAGRVEQDGTPVISRLDEAGLSELASAGGGIFQVADFHDNDTKEIVEAIMSQASMRQDQFTRTRVWNEYFHWLLMPSVLALILLFRPAGGAARTGSEREA